MPEAEAAARDGRTPAQIAEELKAESDRLLHVDSKRALEVAQQILELANAESNQAIQALGYLAEADAFRQLGRYADALVGYERAGAMYLGFGDEVGWARSRIGATLTWRYTGVDSSRLAEIDRAREILRGRGLWLRLARLEQHAGLLLCELGQLDAAVLAYHEALDAVRRVRPRDLAQEARIQGNLALVWQRRGDYVRAQALLGQALEVFQDHGLGRELAVGKAITAQLFAEQGHYSRALETAISARRSFLEIGSVIEAAFVGRAATFCLLALNEFEQAVTLASAVVDEFDRSGATVNVAGTLLLRASAYRGQDRFENALEDLERAATLYQLSDCRGWVAVARAERAAILELAGDWAGAAVEAATASRVLSALGHKVHAAEADLVRASAVRRLGQASEARAIVRTVLRRLGRHGVPWLEYRARRLAAELSMVNGRTRPALDHADAAIQALERLQGRLLTEARAHFLADKHDVYELAIGLALDHGDHARAFEYAERAKSRALVDAFAGQLDIRIRPRSSQEERLQRELTELRHHHDQLANLRLVPSALPNATDTTPAGPDSAAVEELAACERQITAILDELRLGNAADLERVALLQGQTYPLELDCDTVLLEYYAAGEDLCAFVRSTAAVTAYRLAGARPRIERLCALLQLSMQTAAATLGDTSRLGALEVSSRKMLRRLYDELIAPLRSSANAAARLVIVPHGSLHRIPFAALHNGSHYLVEQHEIVVGPSASALAFCRRPISARKSGRLVIGHSNGGALHGAIDEAMHIAGLLSAKPLLEESATRDAVMLEARDADIIHIAAHGVARVDAPLFSHVVLADGHLAALDCFELELDCSLVTLSACETGRTPLAPGDEQLGLPRAFLYAGARSVVQTLWRVDDETTAELMHGLYAGLESGLSRAAALRKAQLNVLQGDEAHRHPFFWAPVVLIGDWGPLANHADRDGVHTYE